MKKRFGVLGITGLLALSLSGCERVGSTPQGHRDKSAKTDSISSAGDPSNAYEAPLRLAQLEDRAVKESSGIVASRRNPDLYWTHNDSGDDPLIYAFDRAGKSRGRWRVTRAEAYDWEDIAAGSGPASGANYLYIGDIGDNDAIRDHITVYRVVEPVIGVEDKAGSVQRATESAEAIRIRYPDGKHDAETLMVHPASGDIYIATKSIKGASGVYKLKAPYSTTAVNVLVRIDEISVRSFVGGVITGGDISPDGKRVILCDYFGAGELVLPEDSLRNFDEIWKQPMTSVDISPRKQGEAVCYRLDGLAILATSEKRPTPLIEARRKR